MNRKYTRERYLEIINSLLMVRPNMLFSSDFIVGYPGETDQDFEDTLKIVDEVPFNQCYSFKYSVRPGTPAGLKPQISEEIKSARLVRLQEKLMEKQKKINAQFVGTVVDVLFEKDGKNTDQIVGKTPHMQSVYISSSNKENLIGQIRKIKILTSNINSFSGELVI
jgi:tRNA-2-methylthio-N6-dimethylallyladenosine synthase